MWACLLLKKNVYIFEQTVSSGSCQDLNARKIFKRGIHLKVLKTLYVRSLQPSLCKQRDSLLGLNVISLEPSAHCYYDPLLGFCPPFLYSSTFFHLYSSFKYFSGVKILIRARVNWSFKNIYIFCF